MGKNSETELLTQKQILGQLIDEALKNGTPISETHAIMKQSKKVKTLIEQINSCPSADYINKDGYKPALLCHPDYTLHTPDEQ